MDIAVFRDHGEIDRKIIQNYATSLGYTFPNSYVELLSKHNGLNPENSYFQFLDHRDELTDRDIYFYSYGYEEKDVWDEEDRIKYESSIKSWDAIELNQPDEYMYENMIVFGQCAGGDFMAFDYRNAPETDNPSIILIYHDDLIEISPNEDKLRAIRIANCFDSFMALLKKDDF